MSGTLPTARTMRHVLGVLERLPLEALGLLAERLIDRLDAAEDIGEDREPDQEDGCSAEDVLWLDHLPGDPDDAEDEPDCCAAGECGGVLLAGDGQPGDATDAEPDDEDLGAVEDEPVFAPPTPVILRAWA